MNSNTDNKYSNSVSVTPAEHTETDAAVPPTTADQTAWTKPSIDVFESSSELLLLADMPGISKENIELTVDSEQLTLVGRWTGEWQKNPLFSEFEPTHYKRVLKLPNGLDLDGVNAKLSEGILTVHLPFVGTFQPRQIEVQGIN